MTSPSPSPLVTRLREELAALCHTQWSGWMRYVFARCVSNTDAGLLISRADVDRWHRQVETPYAILSEGEKDSDRAEADRFIALMSDALLALSPAQETQQLVDDILAEYAGDYSKEACDACEDCGPVVMCRFHSVLSALNRGAGTNPAIERDNLKRQLAQQIALLQTLRAQIDAIVTENLEADEGALWCLSCKCDAHAGHTWICPIGKLADVLAGLPPQETPR